MGVEGAGLGDGQRIGGAQPVDHVAREDLLARLEQREAQASTGIGHGVAVPHAVVEGLDDMAEACISLSM
ncbi:MAG: PTS sugar transporter subunit IIA [Proteobacteria bacterium]|nr:PTS sugar transporter subunit IIA [Pseudomonadota bacterium]